MLSKIMAALNLRNNVVSKPEDEGMFFKTVDNSEKVILNVNKPFNRSRYIYIFLQCNVYGYFRYFLIDKFN